MAGWGLVVSGVLELLILLFAIYGSSALLIKGLAQRYVLKGFGNPLFNVLLGTTNASSSQSLGQEKKKNTKYAEPMALGFFCDTVSPFIFAFYAFHYFPSLSVAAIWITINSAAQLLSSYYAYMRQDCYHATKFGLHCMFWLVKTWEEHVVSVTINRAEAGEVRHAMVGNWFFVSAALVLCIASLNKDTLELIHNSFFVLVTISTISQIPIERYYIFFGVTCSLLRSCPSMAPLPASSTPLPRSSWSQLDPNLSPPNPCRNISVTSRDPNSMSLKIKVHSSPMPCFIFAMEWPLSQPFTVVSSAWRFLT